MNARMPAAPFRLVVHTLALGALALTCVPPAAAGGASAKVERGAYLVKAGACQDCHTPWIMGPKGPQPDQSRALSGHPADAKLPPPPPLNADWAWAGSGTMTAFAGPWGISYAANLTPDKQTGLGAWKEKDFIATLRKGRHAGDGRPILPPMPWEALAHMTDADLGAIFAYLQSLKPIANRVPDYQPPAAAAAK